MDETNQCGILNVRDLHKIQFEKDKDRQKVFDILLERCHRKIVSYSHLHAVNCVYSIPVFVYGLPLYNQKVAYDFIGQKLTEEGFTINHLGNFTLFISWNLNDSNNKIPIEREHKISDNDLPFKSKGYFL